MVLVKQQLRLRCFPKNSQTLRTFVAKGGRTFVDEIILEDIYYKIKAYV